MCSIYLFKKLLEYLKQALLKCILRRDVFVASCNIKGCTFTESEYHHFNIGFIVLAVWASFCFLNTSLRQLSRLIALGSYLINNRRWFICTFICYRSLKVTRCGPSLRLIPTTMKTWNRLYRSFNDNVHISLILH